MNRILNRLNIFRKTRKELKNKTDELKKFRLALDQAPAAVYIINKIMVFEYANPEFTRQSGYTQEDVIGKHVIDSIYKGEIPENRRAIVEALGKGITWQGELYSRHKTGRMYWANTIASPYNNDSGEVDGYIVIQQDVTEEKRMAEALKESEDLHRNLIENSLEGMALTQDGKMLFVNQSFVNMLGYSLDELLQMDPTQILAPEDRERVVDLHYKRMRGELGNLTYNSDFIRKDGSRFTAEMNSAKVQINGHNASLVTMRDITERLKIQQTLRESESKYKALVENSQDGITIVRDNKYLFANQTFCKMLGYTPEELYEIPAVMTIHPDDRAKALEQAERRRNLDFSSINEIYRMITQSGEVRECETTSTLVEFGGIWASFFTSHDITENKRIQIELKESEEKYRQLVESTNSIILKWDQNFNITFLNEYGLSFFGFSRDEIIDKPMVGTIVPQSEVNSGRNLQLLMDEIFKNPENYANNINENICKNGKRVWVSWNNTAIKDDKNNTINMFSVGTDITENIHIQNELKESEEKYRQLFAAESDAIFMINAENGQILDVNPAATAIYGYSKEEFLQMKNTDVSAEPLKTIESTKREETKVLLRFHKKKDGTVFPVELSAGFTIFKGHKIQIVTSRDITESKKMQDALAESELKYRELANLLPQTIYELDKQGNLVYVNKSGMETFGLKPEDIGQSALECFIPEDRDKMVYNIQLTMQGQRKSPMNEYTALSKTGHQFPVLIYGVPIVKNETVIGTRGIIIDISERKAAENALQESEEKYRSLIESANDGVVITQNGLLKFANKAMCEMMQYSFEELVEQSFFNYVPAEEHQFMIETHKRRMSGEEFNVLYRSKVIRKDGQVIDIELNSRTELYNNKPAAFIIIRNINERVAMEKALQESEEKYRSLIENVNDGIIITQLGDFKFVNRAFCDMLQYSAEELIDTPYINTIHPDYKEMMLEYHNRRMKGEDFKAIYRSKLIRKDGKIVTVEINASTSEINGKPSGFIITRDITERLQVEEELQLAKNELELLNHDLEARIIESSQKLAETRTQLINLQKENLQSQFEVLRQQVNPHFLFNSLNVLTSLIKLEPDLAEQFSEHLSKVYRYVLENKDNELVDLNTELRFLDAYIFLLNIRFIDKIKVNIDIPLEKRSYLIIPLAMQLLIENAIKHNIMTKSDPLKIEIFIDEHNFLNVINNLQERPSQLVSTGVGLKNIQNRYLLLNNTQPFFEKTETQFVAKVPLVNS